MKTKRILITYLNNGNLQSQVAKEFLFNNVVNGLIAEGRVVEYNAVTHTGSSRDVKFEDGTRVWLKPFGISTLGMRFTHLYIDEMALNIPKANEIINESYKASVVHGDYMNFDTSDENRMLTFNYQNGEIILKNI